VLNYRSRGEREDALKLAVMQPYLLPYLGYFQLIRAVDKFVLYDDVTYIKGGWINRNRLWVSGKEYLFTLPLSNGNSGVRIHDVEIANTYGKWKRKFLSCVQQSYSRANNFEEVHLMLEGWLNLSTHSIAEINYRTLLDCCAWLGLETEICKSSSVYGNCNLERADRIIDICKKECASEYINFAGGRKLYSPGFFKDKGVNLSFIESNLEAYSHGTDVFVPGLSILDFMMHVPKPKALRYLGEGQIV